MTRDVANRPCWPAIRIGSVACLLILAGPATLQPPAIAQDSVQITVETPSGPAVFSGRRSSDKNLQLQFPQPEQTAPTKTSGDNDQPTEKKDEKKVGKPDDRKAEGDSKPDAVMRPDKPETPPNPDELKVVPNEAGMLTLNFQGQPWPDVITWLKRVSNKSLDWQELPSGFLNLSTHREYTVDEARSLINRHLLARGYTILIRGEMMTVEKIEKLNPAMVPRVAPSALDGRDDYEFVKVSFALTALVAAQAAEELKPMLSPNGKLVPLSHTNRLEAIDSVINLREIRDVLSEEQSGEGIERRVWQFQLKYVRAEDIVDSLYALLGVKKASSGPISSDQMEQLQKMIEQAAQGGKGAPAESKIQIVAVPRENVILVTGPADKVATVSDAVELLDQPSMRSQSMLDAISRTEVYRLDHLDPEKLIETVHELGGLSPITQIRADTSRKAVIVSGSRTDHLIVGVLIEKLDGTTRNFHVISLRKLQAEYVAGSIRLMMGTEKEEKKEDPRRSYYFNPYGSNSSSEKDDSTDKFQVDADVEYNRLLLRSTEAELEQVQDLLIKLGELPMPGGNPSRRRIFETGDLEDALELMERLQKVWPTRGRNQLQIIPPVVEPRKESAVPLGPISPDQLKPLEQKPKANQQKPVSDPPQKTASRAVRIFEPDGYSNRPTLFLTASRSQVIDSEEADGSANSEAPPDTTADPVPPAERIVPAASVDGDAVEERSNAIQESDAALQKLIERLRSKRAADQGQSASATEDADPPAILIRISPNGDISVESDDPAALDLLEDVLDEYAPPKRDWKVIKLKYPNTWAYGVEIILKDIFKEEIEAGEKEGGMKYSPFWGFYPGSSGDSGGARRLSARKPLKIISDRDSHTILVQGASDEQLRMIEELIEVYDQPQSTEAHSIRKTQIFKIHYSKANVIADALKEVYRDLLSENDKALQEARGNKKEDRPSERSYTYIYGGGGDSDGQEQEQPIRFKGLLSIGVDPTANILIISASEGLLNNVAQIVEQLDMAAQPNSSFKVMQVNTRVNVKDLQAKLAKMLGPKAPQQPKNPNAKGQSQNGNEISGNGAVQVE